MFEGRANGGADGEGGGGGCGAAMGVLRRRRQPHSHPSSSGSAASSSSGRRAAEEGEEGGGKKQGRRKDKRREVVVRAIRDRLPAAASCWGNVSVAQGIIGRSGRRERPGNVGRGGDAVEEDDSGAGTTTAAAAAAAAAWCCVCPAGDCNLEANPSANGKEDAGVRSLIERNDFYSDDCNPHADASPAASTASSWQARSPF